MPAQEEKTNSLQTIANLLTSSVGNIGAVAVAITLAATQFKTLSEFPKTIWKNAPDWLGGAIVLAILAGLAFATVWQWVEKRRIKLYAQVGGSIKRGYFTLQ